MGGGTVDTASAILEDRCEGLTDDELKQDSLEDPGAGKEEAEGFRLLMTADGVEEVRGGKSLGCIENVLTGAVELFLAWLDFCSRLD